MDGLKDLIFQVLIFVAVAIAAYFTAKYISRRSMGSAKSRHMRVADRLPLSRDKAVYLIKVGDEYYLLGATSHKMSVLGKPKIEDDEDAGSGKHGSTFAAFMAKAANKKEPEQTEWKAAGAVEKKGFSIKKARKAWEELLRKKRENEEALPPAQEGTQGGERRVNATKRKRLILFGLLLLAVLLITGCSPADAKSTTSAPLGGLLGGRSETLDILGLLTILTLLPSILIMFTSFTRIIIVLSFVRNALGLQQMPPNQVLTGIALILTFFVMSPGAHADRQERIPALCGQPRSRRSRRSSGHWNPCATSCSARPIRKTSSSSRASRR